MDFFSKFTKPADQSKPAASEGTTEPNTDLFGSAKVVAGAAQSYFSHQPPTYENVEVAGATANILGAASEYGKLDKTQGVGKYVDQAESYLKEYGSSNTTAPATTEADDAGVKSEKADDALTKGADACTEEPTKLPEPHGEADLSSKPSVGGGTAAKTVAGGGDDTTESGGKYGEIKEEGLKSDITDVSDQQPKVDKYEASTEEEIIKKPAAVDASEDYGNEAISKGPLSGGDSGYAEEGVPKPYAGGDDASEKVSPAEGGFGNLTKVAGDFSSKFG